MENNYSSLEPWTFRPAFTESRWFPDALTHETETITRALQISVSTDAGYTDVLASVASAGSPSPLLDYATSASGTESAPRPTRSPALSPPAGKVSKRKPRPSKRSTTTLIFADPANFQQIVQQVTGIPSRRTHPAADAVLRPEPRRPRMRAALEGSCWRTLDTSAFSLEQAGGVATGPVLRSQALFGSGPEGPVFPCFPTLESWGPI